jgi:hypothetical protein
VVTNRVKSGELSNFKRRDAAYIKRAIINGPSGFPYVPERLPEVSFNREDGLITAALIIMMIHRSILM